MISLRKAAGSRPSAFEVPFSIYFFVTNGKKKKVKGSVCVCVFVLKCWGSEFPGGLFSFLSEERSKSLLMTESYRPSTLNGGHKLCTRGVP